MAKVAACYLKRFAGVDVNIVESDETGLAMAGGGYNYDDGNIYYSVFGAIISQHSELSFLHTFFHEGRHKLQHEFYEKEDLMLFPPFMLRMLKESLLENSLNMNDREFYRINYDNLFIENDAEIFARYEIYNFIKKMTNAYINSANKSPDEINSILIKSKRLNHLFSDILSNEKFMINNDIFEQLYGGDIINCDYNMFGQSVDRIIATDKYIKSNPELQNKYPILRLLFNGNKPKSYEEIMIDRENLKLNKSLKDQQTIDELYNEIIILDPILSLTERLESGDKNSVNHYLSLHPTLISEYPEETKSLTSKYGNFGPIKK